MNRARTVTAIGAILSALLVGNVYAANTSLPMVGSQWAVYEQTTLTNGNLNFFPADHATTIPANGGVEFAMPDATASSPAYVNYLLDTYTAKLSESDIISATINVVTSPTPPAETVSFVGNPDGGCSTTGGICPGAVRLFFQSNLPAGNTPTCAGSGFNADNYWWSNPTDYVFGSDPTNTNFPLSASLNPANWSNLCGTVGSNDSAFDTAIANIKYLGLSFGSGSFFANGLGVDGTTGTAEFQLLNYGISN